MESPGIAVVIPLFNHESYIGEAIRSVLCQSRPPDRLVVVDDGSTDNSLAAAERALNHAGPTQVELRVQSNRGTARTLNETICSLKEGVIGILNSDDVWTPNRLEILLPRLDISAPSLVFSGVEFFGDSDQEDLRLYPSVMASSLQVGACLPSVGFTLLIRNIAVSTGNFLFTRQLHARIGGFDENLPACHDWQFLLDTLPIVEPVVVPEAHYRYRLHSSNTYRQSANSGEHDMRLLLQSLMAWATAPCSNSFAPTPCNFPYLMPFYVPLWVRTLHPLCHNIPRYLLQIAMRFRQQARASCSETEQGAITRLMMRMRTLDSGLVAAPPPLEQAWRDASDHWQMVRRQVDAKLNPPTTSQCGLSAACRYVWAGAKVTLAAPDSRALGELAAFTGLEAKSENIKLGRAEINLLQENEVYVHDLYRSFRSPKDRLIWAALTVGELLARHSACSLLHAAAIEIDGRAALICGEPYSGKSTTTLRAMARGLAVLGDDQVRVLDGEARIQPLPRPVKLRIAPEDPLPDGVAENSRPLRGLLEAEPTLLLRRGNAIDPAVARSITAIFHLSRSDQPGVILTPVQGEEIQDRLLPQLRGAVIADRTAFAGPCKGLLAVPHFSIVVGPGQTDDALDDLVDTCKLLSADAV
jgi:hypothetical protein